MADLVGKCYMGGGLVVVGGGSDFASLYLPLCCCSNLYSGKTLCIKVVLFDKG